MKIIPLADRVVIKTVEVEETTKGGLILTGSAKEKPQVAEVIAVGPGGVVDGKEVKMTVKTFWNFIQGKDYLNSSWTDQLHQTDRLHVIYLAVDPGHQHHGLADLLMEEVIDYAQKHKMLISLETHNPENVPIYEHFGFKTYGIVEKHHFGLKQYCMIREATV